MTSDQKFLWFGLVVIVVLLIGGEDWCCGVWLAIGVFAVLMTFAYRARL